MVRRSRKHAGRRDGKRAFGAVSKEDDLLEAIGIFLSVVIVVAVKNVNRVPPLREKICFAG